MATNLDLQEQEQLDTLKAFWNKQGNLITWTLILVLGAIAAWNGWQYWQREQAQQAAAMFEELDRSASVGDADKAGRVFTDMKVRYPGTAYAEQGGLVASKVQADKGQADAAKATLSWLMASAKQVEVQAIARLRLAGLQADAKQYDEALKTLEGVKADDFAPLVADRRGDIMLAQGKAAEARNAYQAAWAQMSDKVDYRRLIEAKLTSLGAPPAPSAAASAAASGAAK